MQLVGWVCMCASLFGAWLNAQQDRRGFYVWICTNLVWVVVDVSAGVYSQAALMMVYCGICVYGLVCWKRRGYGTGGQAEAGAEQAPD